MWLDVAARDVESCGGERRGEIWRRLRRTCYDGQLFRGVNSGRSNGEAEGRCWVLTCQHDGTRGSNWTARHASRPATVQRLTQSNGEEYYTQAQGF